MGLAVLGPLPLSKQDYYIDSIEGLQNLKTKIQSIYVFATISLVNHYHNIAIAGMEFILEDRYKIFSSNVLQENLC